MRAMSHTIVHCCVEDLVEENHGHSIPMTNMGRKRPRHGVPKTKRIFLNTVEEEQWA